MRDDDKEAVDYRKMYRMVRETRVGMRQLQKHVKHLDELKTQTAVLQNIHNELLHAATGTDRIPVESVKEMFKEVAKSRSASDRIFGLTMSALVSILIFLLMGEKFGWIKELPRVIHG